MSVLIKGMRMPENCRKCPLMTGTFCDILNKDVDPFYEGAEKRYNNCPLVDLGKHGRLIDADAFAGRIKFIIEQQGYDDLIIDRYSTVGDVLNAVIADMKGMTLYDYENAPTVIEAEDG